MKLYILLLLVVCWVYAAPNHRSHTNLPKIGVNNNKKRPFSIVGSKTSSIKKHPYTAAVLTSSNELLGGGAICDKKWIVTAGWNTYGQTVSSLQVRLGSDNALKGGQVLKLKKMIPHPKYTAEDWDYDIAMLEVSGEIVFTNKTKKIKLTKKPPKNKSSGVVTGWGSRTYLSENADSDKLQELSITMYDRNTCIKKWWDNDSVNPRSYCAYKEDCGPCSYDFGDPLVQKNKLVGMYLGGYGCAMNSYPGLYSDISRFYKWIVDTMKKNSDPVELVDNDKNYYGKENDDEDDSEEEDEDEEDEEEEEEEDGVGGDRDEENDDTLIGEDDAIGVA